MTPIWIALAIALISYLLGSISTARLVARKVAPEIDLDKVELPTDAGGILRLRTVGSTTASIKLGAKIGYLIAFIDIFKGGLPVLILRILYPEQDYHLIAAVCVVAGHNWPIYHRFRGGGGIATYIGGSFIIDPIGAGVSLVSGVVLGAFVFRQMALVFMLGPWIMLVWLCIFHTDWPHIAYGFLINVLLTLAVLPDMLVHIRSQRIKKGDMSKHMDLFPMYSIFSKYIRPKGGKTDQK